MDAVMVFSFALGLCVGIALVAALTGMPTLFAAALILACADIYALSKAADKETR